MKRQVVCGVSGGSGDGSGGGNDGGDGNNGDGISTNIVSGRKIKAVCQT